MQLTDRPDVANNLHAATLVAGGIAGFLLNDKKPKTALIRAAASGTLLTLSNGIKSGDQRVAHAVVDITGLLALMTGTLFSKAALPSEKTKQKLSPQVRCRRATTFGFMTLTGLAATGVYVAGFIAKRRANA